MAKVDTTKVRRAFKRAEKDPAIAELAVAAFKKPLRDGLRRRIESGGWAPNSPEWAARKKKRGWSSRPLVRTGKTLRAVTANALSKLGTSKGVKVGVNWRNLRAFASPRVFTDSKGKKRLPAGMQDKVFNTLKRGGALSKIAASARKKGVGFLDALSAAFGPGRRQRSAAKKGKLGIPPRPAFAWDRSWDAEVTKDLEGAVASVLQKAGLAASNG